MLTRLFQHPIVHVFVVAAIAGGVFICVFPDFVPSLSWVLNYAVQLMLFYLFAGLVMLFLKQPRLTFAFFGGCAMLCFYLKYSVKSDGIERWRQNVIQSQAYSGNNVEQLQELKIAHINLTNTNERSEALYALRTAKADLISLHEVTPDWNRWLLDSLSGEYPYSHTLVDIGIFGMAIYSRYEILDIDTLYYQEIPSLVGKLRKNGEILNFISIHTIPALDAFSKRRLREHLDLVRHAVNEMEGPVVIFGDFNSVAWSSQIQIFLNSTNLMESRAGFMPFSSEGTFSFWDLPLDHIFFSGHFKCVKFENLPGYTGQHLGITGKYHFPYAVPHAKKISK